MSSQSRRKISFIKPKRNPTKLTPQQESLFLKSEKYQAKYEMILFGIREYLVSNSHFGCDLDAIEEMVSCARINKREYEGLREDARKLGEKKPVRKQ